MTTLTDAKGMTLTVSGCGRCSSCRTLKPRSEFYADRSRSTGISSRCIPCDRQRLTTLPERSLVRDLKALITRHPSYRPLLESFASAVAA
jgi:hypothetical protein